MGGCVGRCAATLSDMSIGNFGDVARDDFAVDVATGLSVPRGGVRVTGAGARAGSVVAEASVAVVCDAEAAAAFASSLTDPAEPLVGEFIFGPCAMSGVHIEELAVVAAVPEETPEPAAAPKPAPPPTSTAVVFHGDDDNGGPWDYAVADDEGELGAKEEAVRQDSGGISAAAAAAAGGIGLQLSQLLCTGVSTCQEEPPSPPALDNASATGRTYGDIIKSPPPHLWCVVSPLSSLLPTSGAPPRHHRIFFVADVPELRRLRPWSLRGCRSVVWCLVPKRVPSNDCVQRGTRGPAERSSTSG